MTKTKELKPPPELVDAIQQSDDMTAPADMAVTGTEFGADVPRAIRNRLVHEEPQKLSHDAEEGQDVGGKPGLMDKRELKDHIAEMKHAHADQESYNRSHPGAGKAGQGDAGTVNSQVNAMGEGGGRMRYGHT
ncbi:hypothetical protein HYH03_009331 [Edaphochlamys debaryana]|uniref:Uncharacterized protein n=1 Tax=Edaphochlamys debaryana TaxID=47281 RepID=A0A835Y0H5_9CHLO|nr:hypothetical protein HYH03_009331 [Edaphochlamys debaryana]|eukprot:KAG2492383.1 hypothetical protein HYH03_009331 [Edaphochlamys debaryana]